jgi:hypothetical protein
MDEDADEWRPFRPMLIGSVIGGSIHLIRQFSQPQETALGAFHAAGKAGVTGGLIVCALSFSASRSSLRPSGAASDPGVIL